MILCVTGNPCVILCVTGNPWPPVRPQPRDTSLQLHNALLNAARQEYRAQPNDTTTPTTTARHVHDPAEGSSVDGIPGSSVDIDNESFSGAGKGESSGVESMKR